MIIDKRRWHAKLFREGLRICAQFTRRKHLTWEYENRTNLCHYMRVILVYVPGIVVLQLLTWMGVVFALVVIPIAFFGMGSYGMVLGAIALFLCAATLVILAIAGGVVGWEKLHRKYYRQSRPVKYPRPPGEKSFAGYLWDYLKAKKQGICPLITFEED